MPFLRKLQHLYHWQIVLEINAIQSIAKYSIEPSRDVQGKEEG